MDDRSEKTHLPVEGATIEPRGYHLGISFHPSIRLERKDGHGFARDLAEIIDPSETIIEENAWVFSQPIPGSTRSLLRVSVSQAQLKIDAEFPRQAKEWFEDRQVLVLRKFAEQFKLTYILQSAAMVRGVLAIDGDARIFLSQKVMNIRGEHFAPFGRPIHMVGLTLGFPPYRIEAPNGIRIEDSVVEVRAESLNEDPSKLFLEAQAQWVQPLKCDQDSLARVVDRQREVSDYLGQKITEFLKRATQQGQGGD